MTEFAEACIEHSQQWINNFWILWFSFRGKLRNLPVQTQSWFGALLAQLCVAEHSEELSSQ